MDRARGTDDQILGAFLRLASERGLAGVTTNAIAVEAGVNPVTLFRRFGDKTTIALEAIRRYSPAVKLRAQRPRIDPENALDGLVACMMRLREMMPGEASWLTLCLLHCASDSELQNEINTVARAIYDYLREALLQALPALRPEADVHVTVLQWIGLLVATRRIVEVARPNGTEPENWRELFEAAVRPVLR